MSGQPAQSAYCDVAVIGGGVLGCFAARELAALGFATTLIEQEPDLCSGITKANTAIVYSGAYAKPGTLKADLCVQANRGFEQLCSELKLRFERCGSLMLCFGQKGLAKLEQFLDYGQQNGVAGLRIVSNTEAHKLQPGLSADVYKALFDPNVGTVLPWELGLAAAQDAALRGATIWRGTQLCAITPTGKNAACAPHATIARETNSTVAKTLEGNSTTAMTLERNSAAARTLESNSTTANSGTEHGYTLSLVPTPGIPKRVRDVLACPSKPLALHARAVVNCAGLHAGDLLEMLTEPQVHIVPEKACYYVLDTKVADKLQHIIFCEPEKKQKGLTLVPSIGGNIVIGPTQEEARGPDDRATTQQGFDWLEKHTQQLMPSLALKHLIRSFAATRPNPYWAKRDDKTGKTVLSNKSINDFIIEEHDEYPGFVSLIGIKTPGLTCAHELGVFVASKLASFLRDQRFSGKEKLQVGVITEAGAGASAEVSAEANTRPDAGAGTTASASTQEHAQAAEGTAASASTQEHAQAAEGSTASASAGAGDASDSEDRRIVCRCRSITRSEIIAALHREPQAVTLDGIKRLTECGSGRCQGSFCTQRVLEIMAEELKLPVSDILKDLPGSRIVLQEQEPATPQTIAAPQTMTAPSLSSPPDTYNVAIIGGGAAGMTAALELAQQGVRDIALIEREAQLGGVLNQCIHDGFGMEVFAQNITGVDFAARLRTQIEQNHAAISCFLDTSVLSIEALQAGKTSGTQDVSGQLLSDTDTLPQARLLLSSRLGRQNLLAHKVVLASGCRERPAASLPLAGTRPAGIVAAGALQKMLNCAHWRLGTRAVILGSGDVGLIMAQHLKLSGCEVLCVVEISDKIGGRPFNKQRCLDAYNIPLVLNSTVTEVFGKQRVSAVTVQNINSGEKQHINCNLLISSLGLIPERELIDQWASSLPPWLIACGNADHVYELVDGLVTDTRTRLQGFIKATRN